MNTIRLMNYILFGVILLAAAFSPAALEAQPSLYVGWGSESITPEEPVLLRGQAHRRIATDANDPITCTALVLETREQGETVGQTVMVSVDLIGMPSSLQSQIRKAVKTHTPAVDTTALFINAIHTHAAPYIKYDYNIYKVPESGVMTPDEYAGFLAERVSQAVDHAWQSRGPGGMTWGLGQAVTGSSRMVKYRNGTSHMYGKTNRKDFAGFGGNEDHAVKMLFFWNQQAKLTGVVLNVSTPAQTTEFWRNITADYWHETRQELRARISEDLYVLPQIGPAGEISPHLQYREEAEYQMQRRFGMKTGHGSRRRIIADRITDAVENVLPYSRDIQYRLPLKHKAEIISLPKRVITEEEYRQAKERYDGYVEQIESGEAAGSDPAYRYIRRYKSVLDRYEIQDEKPNLPVEIHTVRVGDVALTTNPFELYVDYGSRIEAQSPAVLTLNTQLASGSHKYLPTADADKRGGYSAEPASSVVGPEGGDVLVNESVRLLKSLWEEDFE